MFHHGDGDSPCLSRLPFGVILQDFSFVPSLSRARIAAFARRLLALAEIFDGGSRSDAALI